MKKWWFAIIVALMMSSFGSKLNAKENPENQLKKLETQTESTSLAKSYDLSDDINGSSNKKLPISSFQNLRQESSYKLFLEDSPIDAYSQMSSKELYEEKLAEKAFLESEYTEDEIQLPTDFYVDPLKSLQNESKTSLDSIDTSKFGMPIVFNEDVRKWIRFFTGKGRKFYSSWLAKTTLYLPVIEEQFVVTGVPKELLCVAMIESGFSPQAVSPANATGMWQFMQGTASIYGLKTNRWIDERKDPDKSSVAAAKLFKELYSKYGDWYLALAAYNAGEGRISRIVSRTGIKDYWRLARLGYLPHETKNYIPKFLAAAIIAKMPEKFGFQNILYEETLQYELYPIQEPIDLNLIAYYVGATPQKIMSLNPALRQTRTPPGSYNLRIPQGKSLVLDVALNNLSKDNESQLVYKHYKVQKGDSLASIAKKNAVTVEELQNVNLLKNKGLVAGKTIFIPKKSNDSLDSFESSDPNSNIHNNTVDNAKQGQDINLATNKELVAYNSEKQEMLESTKNLNSIKPLVERVAYKIKNGDNIFAIAKKHSVSVATLKSLNNINAKDNKLVAGQTIWLPSYYSKNSLNKRNNSTTERSADKNQYTAQSNKASPKKDYSNYKKVKIKSGDSIWSIAKKYMITRDDILKHNNLKGNAPLAVGSVILLPRK